MDSIEKVGEGSREQIRRPNMLDIVKINGRWAQVQNDLVIFLNDKSSAYVNWDDFDMVKDHKEFSVKHVKQTEHFTEDEINNIFWGPEQKQNPHLKEEVSVFGEYVSKKNN